MRILHSRCILPAFFAATALASLGCSSERVDDAASALEEHFPDTAARVLAGARPIFATDRGFALETSVEPALGALVHPIWPARGEDAVRLEVSGGFAIAIHETGLVGDAQPSDRAVAYPREAGASFWGASTDGVEEWLHLGPGVAVEGHAAVVYRVEGGTLRQNGARVEILDDADDVRLEVSAPEAFAAGGARIPVTLAVRGDTIELHVDAGGAAALVDPIWTATGSMATARYGHAALRLASGDVLVAGGYNDSGFVSAAERYVSGAHAWSPSGTLAEGRQNPSLVTIPGGRALAIGGIGAAGYLASTEIYTASTNAWTAGPAMSSGHYVGTASAIKTGVLVAGGRDATFLTTAEIYSPATNTWAPTGSMAVARWAHAAVTLVPSGKVLVVGGQNAGGYVSSAEVWDPATNAWSSAGSLITARRGHRASLLGGGKVIVLGGEDGTGSLASAEVWDPVTNVWTAAAPMSQPRYFPALVRSGSSLLVIGGRTNDDYTATTELYDPATNTWSNGQSMGTGRYFHTATELPSQGGAILVSGGWNGVAVQTSAEIY